jgi:hypothetical protein
MTGHGLRALIINTLKVNGVNAMEVAEAACHKSLKSQNSYNRATGGATENNKQAALRPTIGKKRAPNVDIMSPQKAVAVAKIPSPSTEKLKLEVELLRLKLQLQQLLSPSCSGAIATSTASFEFFPTATTTASHDGRCLDVESIHGHGNNVWWRISAGRIQSSSGAIVFPESGVGISDAVDV